MMPSPERIMDLNVVAVAGVAWELFDFGMNRVPKTPFTDAIVRHIKVMQTPAGNWSTNESRRPPMAAGDFQAAALSIYSLKQYGQDADKAETDAVIAKAVKWLENTKPATTQDRAFHLLGLAWGNAAPATIKAAARALAATQRADGGWNQLPEMVSDCVCDGAGAVCVERGRQDGGVQPRVPEGRRLPASHAGARRIVACGDPRHLAAAVLRERIPVWARPVHLSRRNGMGGDGARARSAVAAIDYVAVVHYLSVAQGYIVRIDEQPCL